MKKLMLLIICATASARFGYAQDLTALRTACAADAQKFCSQVQQGGGRVVACLKENKDSLSDQCRQAAGLPPKQDSSAPPSAASSPATPPPAPPQAALPPKRSSAKSTQAKGGSAKNGEKFVERVVTDTGHEGMRAVTLHVPEKWHLEGKIEWHYNWVEYPLSYSAHVENPDNAEAYFQYPLLRFDSIEVAPQMRQYNRGHETKPGDRLPTGAISYAPQPPVQALAMFIKQVRPNVANFKWIGQQDLPDLAKVLKLPAWPNQHGLAIKIGYDLNGQPVEEAFFGVYYITKVGSGAVSAGQLSVPAGAIQQTNWGFQGLQSMRAPAGTLDKRMPMFCVIAKSIYVNPEWSRLVSAINAKMLADFNQKLKEGDDQLVAAQKIMEQTMRDQAAFQANFDKQEAAFRNSPGINDDNLRSDGGGRDGGARSASDHWSDLMRGVDTMNDPSNGGTTQLSNLGSNHFTDGFGNYRTYDDSNATPENQGENGSWTRMTEAQ